jgi:predicted nuclease of restriction endonuclease-like RecB superfamily
VLTKDLLRVSRAGGGYSPQFIGADREQLAARLIGVYQGHVGKRREQLQAAITDIERESDDFKLVRGFAKLLDSDAAFETRAPLPPQRARKRVFEAAEDGPVVTETDRETTLKQAADSLGIEPGTLEETLYADLDDRQILTEFDPRWSPADLCTQYNLSVAQTALFDATELRIRSSDPKAVISAIKRLRLMYEIRDQSGGRTVIVTGPDALFTATRRYGTRFARLLRTVVTAANWELSATIADRGTERTLELSTGDVSVPGVGPVTEVSYDSGVESDFATRFVSLGLDWDLVREPEPLAAGEHVVIPDFAFDWRPGGDASVYTTGQGETPKRIFFEVMGFWTPEYVETKLDRLAEIDDVEMLVAVDESLGVGEEIEARDHRAIPYSGTVRVADVRDALRPYEAELVAAATEDIPETLRPDADVISLATLAEQYGVSEDAIEDKRFPEHELVGRTLLRPSVIDEVTERIESGMSLSAVEDVFEEYGIEDDSAVLSRLGYRVEWEGLSGGTVRDR